MRTEKKIHGGTLIELMVVVAIVALVSAAFALFFGKNTAFYKRTRVRQQVMSDSRICMDTILQRLRSGKANTVFIQSVGTPLIPNSRIDFVLQTELPSGATAYAIYLAQGRVFTQEYVKTGPPQPPPRLLASNVTSLMFTGDSHDPAIVKVTLQIKAPWDASNKLSHVSTLILPNEVVHMTETP